jgi:hypothetical protein
MTVDLRAPGPVDAGPVPPTHRSSRPITGSVGTPVAVTRGTAIALGFVGGGTSPLLWAVEEAERTGRELRLVMAADEPVTPLGHHFWRREVEGLVRHLALTGLEYTLGSGPAAEVLLAAATEASGLVIGRQTSGTTRGVEGTTSAVLGQRSPVPLIVVPQQWSQSSTFNAPVLVATSALEDVDDDGRARSGGALCFAVERATRYRVPLVIASGELALPASAGASPASDGSSDWLQRLEAFRAAHATMEIVTRSLPGSIAEALEETSGLAQMVVVSRPVTSSDAAADGLVRHLLRRSSAPVAIIPPLS